MARIFLIHGAHGNPEENWFPWLKTELEKLGHAVIAPHFPIGAEQTLQNWQRTFEPYAAEWREDSIIVGHSLGAPFLLRFLETHRAKAAFCIAAFAEYFPELAPFGTETFLASPFDWKRIRANCPHFTIYHSDNDPYVPLEKAEYIARNLGVNVLLIKNAGHFNAAAGYTEFAALLQNLTRI